METNLDFMFFLKQRYDGKSKNVDLSLIRAAVEVCVVGIANLGKLIWNRMHA